MASGTDDFTVPVPLQGGGIDVYECLEGERKEELEGEPCCLMANTPLKTKHTGL